MKACPQCGAHRDGAVRFCPGCGLDYWRHAAGQAAQPQAAAAPGPEARTPRPRAGLFLTVGAVMLLGAGGAAVVMSGVLPSGVPGGRPAATPRQLTAEEALVYAFFREVRDPDAAYRVTMEGRTTYSGIAEEIAPVELAGEFRLNGDDWTGRLRLVQHDEVILDAAMTLVADVGYLREAGAEWVSDEIPDRLQPISPFRRISTVTEVAYLDPVPGEGVPKHSLLITKWLGGRDYSDSLRRVGRMESQDSRMKVFVDAFGVPSTAELEIQVVASDARETLTISSVVTYRFDSWDDVGPIDAPVLGENSAWLVTTQ